MNKNILCIDLGKKKNGLAYDKKNLIKCLRDFTSKSLIEDILIIIKFLLLHNLKTILIGNLEKKSKENFINKKSLKFIYILNRIKNKLKINIKIKTQEEEYTTEEARKKYKNKKDINSKSAKIMIEKYKIFKK